MSWSNVLFYWTRGSLPEWAVFFLFFYITLCPVVFPHSFLLFSYRWGF